MVDTTILNQDPYEDVLKQLLAEIAELRQKIEINANQPLQEYQGNLIPALYPKVSVKNSCGYVKRFMFLSSGQPRYLNPSPKKAPSQGLNLLMFHNSA